MVKIKMHAMYDHFPELNPTNRLEPHIDCYSDMHVFDCKKPGANIALLLEPRSMIEKSYEFVYDHPDYFRYIFTHDSQLLNLPNARMLNWADVWLTTDSEKNMGISLVTSPKDWCPTFALYRPYCKGVANIYSEVYRTSTPYLIRHLPWYVNSENMSEEEQYYVNNITQSTHWSIQAQK